MHEPRSSSWIGPFFAGFMFAAVGAAALFFATGRVNINNNFARPEAQPTLASLALELNAAGAGQLGPDTLKAIVDKQLVKALEGDPAAATFIFELTRLQQQRAPAAPAATPAR